MFEKMFKLKENNTTVKTEVVAGLTTFMTMAYILALNPAILSVSGMDPQAVLMATALAAFIGTIAMALLANYPFALAPGLGLNAYFAYTVCGTMGYSWQVALFAVFIEGLIFILLSLTNVREAIFNAIPTQLKKGVSVGIGLFVAFIGLQDAGIIVDGSTLVTVVKFTENFRTAGISALLALIGLLLIAILYVKRVKGSILIGIVVTWVLGIICQLTGLYQGTSLLPQWSNFDLTAIGKTFGQCFNLSGQNINVLDFVIIMFAFLFVDIFDTLGTLIGVANKVANITDRNITSDLAIRTLRKALESQPTIKEGLILHSDQGSQYTSKAFTEFCESVNVTQSMSKAGYPYDNAPMERYFNTLKNECTNLYEFTTEETLYQKVEEFAYVDYNHVRPHSYNGYRTPYEARTAA